MSKHTQEPWEVMETSKYEVKFIRIVWKDVNEIVTFVSTHPNDYEAHLANAKRIAACVNACAELSDEEETRLVPLIPTMQDELERLCEQCDDADDHNPCSECANLKIPVRHK